MEEHRLTVQGTELRLLEWGSEPDRPLLFWHALGDHTALQIGEAAPDLVRHGLRVVAADAPGFGRSQPLAAPDAYLGPSLARLVVGLLDALELERAALVGASWGGTVSVHTAAAHPERVEAIALLDGGYRDPTVSRRSLQELRAHWREQPGFRYPSWDALFDEARDYFGRWSPALESALGDAFEERDGEIRSRMGPDLYAAVIWAYDRSPPSSAFAGLAAGRVPVLALVATEPPDDGRDAAVEAFRRAVPTAEVRLLPGRRHALVEEAPAEVAGLVGGWLRTL